jgi:desumoylating isopeptidase 1
MDVQLYVYDLSKGLARQFSQQFLGTHIDAVYHTSVVLDGVEYFFGAGVQTSYPGQTHHGQPMEVVKLGRTELPIEIILEYLDSLREVYTAESYDLFLHNCNNFSNDFAMFLVGKGIPEHITSLPRTVLSTPFGQMLQPQLDRAMRGITQAPVHSPGPRPSRVTGEPSKVKAGSRAVKNVTNLRDLEQLLDSAKKSCAVIFFTSSTCGPCKVLYPAYDELAAEAGEKAVLIKVDINRAYDVATKYSIRATPTFFTFLKGQKEEEWSGADEPRLRGTVRMLVEAAHPPHPHRRLKLPKLLNAARRAVTYTKMPPLDKLLQKLGPEARNPSAIAMKTFLTAAHSIPQESRLPALPDFAAFMQSATIKLPPEAVFAAYDLFRLALTDARVSAFFAEEAGTPTILQLLKHVNGLTDIPYNLRIVTLQMSCNLFAAQLSSHVIVANATVIDELVALVASSLLDSDHANVRVAAASLAFNIAAANHKPRLSRSEDVVSEEKQVEMLAAVIEALQREKESKQAVTGLVLALGLLIYCAPSDGQLLDLCRAMEVSDAAKGKEALAEGDAVFKEVVKELLVKGL